MIAVVIAYQSVVQLRPYGTEDFTVNLVAVSVLREMGVLITAIMVAGRSGSAFTAEIGVMKAREEIDALRTMGLDPMELLVVPRVIGLVVTLPLLTFFADAMGLVGGAMVTNWLLHVPLSQFSDRVPVGSIPTISSSASSRRRCSPRSSRPSAACTACASPARRRASAARPRARW